jgi:hypothetical protein
MELSSWPRVGLLEAEMHLIQLLLPLRTNAGLPYEDHLFRSINASLVETFGGVTAFSRAPAKGTWINADREEMDDVIVVEVMADNLDRVWWRSFRERLEAQMGQTEIVVRSHSIDRL